MHKLVAVLMATAFGAALMFSAGGPYELAARNLEINRTSAAEVHKVAASQDAMSEQLNRPTLPAGMSIVLPRNGGGA